MPTVPPVPQTPNAVPVTFGTILHFGLPDIEVTGIIVDSYKRDAQYAQTQEVTDQMGTVIGLRMSDFRAQVSVDGRVLASNTANMPPIKAGDILTINVDKIAINSVSYSGQANGFHNFSLSGTAYSGIDDLAPAGSTYSPVIPGEA
jgi:hypothetical protein